MIKRKVFILLATLLVLVPLVAAMSACAPQSSGPIQLTFAHWGSPRDPHSRVFEAWAKELNEKTGGRVTVTISYGAALGKSTEHYDLALKGIADIANFAGPWTPGRFPISEMMGLPIRGANGETASKAYWELYKRGYLNEELKDVKVLWLFTTGNYHLLWGKKAAPTLADFAGRKVRSAGGAHTVALEALGMVPVSMVMGDMYDALQKGTLDGSLFPLSSVPPYKFEEVAKYMTRVSLFYFPFGTVMNKDRWDKLPKDIQKIIDDMDADAKYTILSGKAHDEDDKLGLDTLIKAGATVQDLSAQDTAAMMTKLKPLWDKWIADQEAKKLPGKKAVDELYNILTGFGVKDPFVR